jgi:ribosomal protein S18 acetylase RimI-like enzyme
MAEKTFSIRSLSPKDLNQMYFTFLDAFSDYPMPFRLNKEQFVRKFVEKLKVNFSLSCGIYEYDAMAGFIFTSTSYYHGKLTAYNGGTGVRPSYRGNRLTCRMYEYLMQPLKKEGVKQCVLEVLINNPVAIKVYEEIGFQKHALLSCFKLKGNMLRKVNVINNMEIRKISQPDWSQYETFQDFPATFLDSFGMINQNLINEDIIEARIEDETVGYAIYQSAFGRLSQLAVKPEMRRKGIGSALMKCILSTSYNKELSVINVNDHDNTMISFLEALNFKNHLNQYEMLLQVL